MSHVWFAFRFSYAAGIIAFVLFLFISVFGYSVAQNNRRNMDYVPIIQSGITAVAVVVAAYLGVRIYRAQKNLDRKQDAYAGYLAAFHKLSSVWEPGTSEWDAAKSTYNEVQQSMLLVASRDVFDATWAFHTCLIEPGENLGANPQQWEDELKTKYARMVAEMRRDGFAEDISEGDIRARIPWQLTP